MSDVKRMEEDCCEACVCMPTHGDSVARLPDYEAAVEALERLVDQFDNYDPVGIGYTGFSVEPARAALARLRESVPA